MKLAKKSRIRAKQIKANKARFEAMTEFDIEREFRSVAEQVKRFWKRRGISFSNR